MRNYVQEHMLKHPLPPDKVADEVLHRLNPDTYHMTYHVVLGIECADGTVLSVQASGGHYCTPKVTGAKEYTHYEVYWPAGYKNRKDNGEDADPEGYVPIGRINKFIHTCGGVK
jgi:hypothetical protein